MKRIDECIIIVIIAVLVLFASLFIVGRKCYMDGYRDAMMDMKAK